MLFSLPFQVKSIQLAKLNNFHPNCPPTQPPNIHTFPSAPIYTPTSTPSPTPAIHTFPSHIHPHLNPPHASHTFLPLHTAPPPPFPPPRTTTSRPHQYNFPHTHTYTQLPHRHTHTPNSPCQPRTPSEHSHLTPAGHSPPNSPELVCQEQFPQQEDPEWLPPFSGVGSALGVGELILGPVCCPPRKKPSLRRLLLLKASHPEASSPCAS